MNFTYNEYEKLLDLLKEKNYKFCDFRTCSEEKRCVILRHDVDFTLNKALELARFENSKNIKSTYFILLSTSFYNIFSKASYEIVNEIVGLGHRIGLHFDEKRYKIADLDSLESYINYEKSTIENLIGCRIEAVSMHRPSNWILENDIQFNGLINTYSKHFIQNIKYLSDSRMFWREDVFEIVEKVLYQKLHILTHPFWYSYKEETMKDKIVDFIQSSKLERYNSIEENFRALEEVISYDDILGS